MMGMLEKYDKFVAIEKEEETKQIKFYGGKMEVIKEWKSREMEWFLYKDGRLLNISMENADERKAEKMLKRAEKIFPNLVQSPFEIGEGRQYKNDKILDEEILDDERMKDKVEGAIVNGMEYGKDVSGVLYSSMEKIKVHNSRGVVCEDRNSSSYLSIRVFTQESSGHAVSCSRTLRNIDEKVGKEAGEIASMGKERKKIKEGRYDVILAPMAFANLISNFGMCASSFAVDAGYSFLKDKIGEKVGSENVTIYDSGIEKDGIFSRKFDDEGVATRRNVIMEKGIIKKYLHNGTTAMVHGTKTTGNAGIISPHPWNLIVEKGRNKVDDMMKEIDGLMITNVWYTRFHNYSTGDFSTVARDGAFLIKNGNVEYGVKGIRITDNLGKMLKNVEMLSKERKQIYWWEIEYPVFAPYAMVRDVSITTS